MSDHSDDFDETQELKPGGLFPWHWFTRIEEEACEDPSRSSEHKDPARREELLSLFADVLREGPSRELLIAARRGTLRGITRTRTPAAQATSRMLAQDVLDRMARER